MAFCYVKKSLTIFGFNQQLVMLVVHLGAALSTWYLHHNKERTASKERDAMKGAYLGPEFTDTEIEAELTACGAVLKSFLKTK
jgi:hypothetical protein